MALLLAAALPAVLTACGAARETVPTAAQAASTADAREAPETTALREPEQTTAAPEPSETQLVETTAERTVEKMLQMTIGGTAVRVNWENNRSVEALKALCESGPLTIQASMYGGFEQVGSIGRTPALRRRADHDRRRGRRPLFLQSDRRVLRLQFLGLYPAGPHHRPERRGNGSAPRER